MVRTRSGVEVRLTQTIDDIDSNDTDYLFASDGDNNETEKDNEAESNFEDANHYIKVVHGLGVATLPLYKLFLRMFLNAQRPAWDILQMMKKDRIELDDETSVLVALNS